MNKKIIIIVLIVVSILSSCSIGGQNAKVTEQSPAMQNTRIVTAEPSPKRQLYEMNSTEDAIIGEVPNPGKVINSIGVNSFMQLNLSDDIYLVVKISPLYDFEPFVSIDEYVYEGRTVVEWKNDVLTKQYHDYYGDYKEIYYNSDEYKKTLDNRDLDEKYREYLLEIAGEENNLNEIIAMYDKYENAQEVYKSAEREHMKELHNRICTDEYNRLLEHGLFVELMQRKDLFYEIKGELNSYDIENFPVSDTYGYTIVLYDTVVAMNE